MPSRRILAILLLVLPVIFLGWIAGTISLTEATTSDASLYPNVSEAALLALEKAQLAKIAAGTMTSSNGMNALWRKAKGEYEQLLFVLLGVTTTLTIALSCLLWKLPPNRTAESDARDRGARGSP